MTLASTLVTAFMVGLLGSVHCFAMCGGIAAAAGSTGQGSKAAVARRTLLLNGGRVFSYSVMGLIVGSVTGSVGQLLELQHWGYFLRMLTALLIFLLGLQYLTNRSYLNWVEQGGSKLWQWLSRKNTQRRRSSKHTPNQSWTVFRTGMLWGWLPCGLVYTILLTAAASGKAVPGMLIMLAFGLGTLPALASLTVVGPLVSQLRSSIPARRVLGIAMLIFALWITGWTFVHQGQFENRANNANPASLQHQHKSLSGTGAS